MGMAGLQRLSRSALRRGPEPRTSDRGPRPWRLAASAGRILASIAARCVARTGPLARRRVSAASGAQASSPGSGVLGLLAS